MRQDAKDLLATIGRHLDGSSFPVVMNRGVVMPGRAPVLINPPGKEKQNERKAPRRPAADARPRAEGWAWQAGGLRSRSRPWTSRDAPPLVLAVDPAYQDPLASVRDAYPDAQVWQQEGGFWLTAGVALIPDCDRRARLLVAVSESHRMVRAWAFWDGGVLGSTWIGPRHTNFPDGSICAFDLSDRTWVFGAPLVELLDLYVVWVVRHLHYEVFGRWPGPQSVPLLIERLLEVQDGELCGCEDPIGIYADCCKRRDEGEDVLRAAIEFLCLTQWAQRSPPHLVAESMRLRVAPPPIQDIF